MTPLHAQILCPFLFILIFWELKMVCADFLDMQNSLPVGIILPVSSVLVIREADNSLSEEITVESLLWVVKEVVINKNELQR